MDVSSIEDQICRRKLRWGWAHRKEGLPYARYMKCLHPAEAQRLINNRKKVPESPDGWLPAKDGPQPFNQFPQITASLLRRCRRGTPLLGFRLETAKHPLWIGNQIRQVTHYREAQLQQVNALYAQELGRYHDPDGTVWLTLAKAEEIWPDAKIEKWAYKKGLPTEKRLVWVMKKGGPRRRGGPRRAKLVVVREKDVLAKLAGAIVNRQSTGTGSVDPAMRRDEADTVTPVARQPPVRRRNDARDAFAYSLDSKGLVWKQIVAATNREAPKHGWVGFHSVETCILAVSRYAKRYGLPRSARRAGRPRKILTRKY
jgi:hypothetical protein